MRFWRDVGDAMMEAFGHQLTNDWWALQVAR